MFGACFSILQRGDRRLPIGRAKGFYELRVSAAYVVCSYVGVSPL